MIDLTSDRPAEQRSLSKADADLSDIIAQAQAARRALRAG